MNQTSSSSRVRDFPLVPAGWYYAGAKQELNRGPIGVDLMGDRFVVYRTSAGRFVALDGRCSHMSADLSLGIVSGECIRCPLHEWEYAPDGKCAKIPATSDIPPFAVQASYPVIEQGGHLFFFNRRQAIFPCPFFDGKTPEDLIPARPFAFNTDMPWYLIAANGFDIQHFRAAHDRTLIGEPFVESPSPFARSITGHFAVAGTNARDRLTRMFSGPDVRMTVTSWCGTMILVSAQFRRTTSYGMVCVTPLAENRSHLRVIVWVPRSRSVAGRMVVDPLDAMIRRSFIRAFVKSDADRSTGLRYNPHTLIPADRELAGYLEWLREGVKEKIATDKTDEHR